MPPKIQKCIRSGRNLYRGQVVVQTSQAWPSIGVSNYEEDGTQQENSGREFLGSEKTRRRNGDGMDAESHQRLAWAVIPAASGGWLLQACLQCGAQALSANLRPRTHSIRRFPAGAANIKLTVEGSGAGGSHALSRWLQLNRTAGRGRLQPAASQPAHEAREGGMEGGEAWMMQGLLDQTRR